MSISEPSLDSQAAKRRKLSHGAEEMNKTGSDTIISGENDAASAPDAKRRPRANSFTKKVGGVTAAQGGIKASAMALQFSDLNDQVTPNYERLRKKWTPIARKLDTIIKQIPEKRPVSAVEAIKAFRKLRITVPFPEPKPTKETNYKFEFKPPTSITFDGALPDDLSINEENSINIRVMMPESLFQEKDYLNNRAFHKAAFYLSCIASAFKESIAAEFSISFAFQDGIDLLPVIIISPTDSKASKFSFQVSIVFPSDVIPLDKTLPTKNCLRQATAENSDVQASSPFYNSAIRYVSSSSKIASLLKSARSPSFDEACRIGQIWLRQRGFSSSINGGGFGFQEWIHICGLLLQTGGHRDHPLFSKQYSGVQFFKAMLQLIASRDLREPWIVGSVKLSMPRSDAPVLFDASTGVNILYKMTSWSYQLLRHYAQASLSAINAKNQENFESIFLLKVAEQSLQYDELLSVKIPGGSFATSAEQLQYLQKLYSVISRGLGDRVNLVNFAFSGPSKWSLKQDSTAFEKDLELVIGLLTNPDNVNRLVDHGPSADEPEEAAEFQRFWGEKSELRRFKDGSISESLVWTVESPVTLQIIRHLVLQHFQVLPSSVTLRSRDLVAEVLEEPGLALTTKDAFRVINNTYQSLTSKLHGLEGLPLPIRSIQPADPALRSSTVDHPLLPSTTKPINILIQFDSSARWPDSLSAIQHTKIAFLLKLSELLNEADSILTTRIGLENTENASSGHLNTSFLDIIYPSSTSGISPICFRARILHDRESHLLQAALADKSLHGSVRDSLSAALATDKRTFLAPSIHTTTIRTLCTRFPPLSGTIRLLKKWVSSHRLLHQNIPPEALEIFAAHVFLHPTPWSTPGSSTTAFLRCLHFLSRWDWAVAPVVVDLSLAQEMTNQQTEVVRTRFQAWRKLDPGFNNVVWCIGSNLDETGTVWTGGARPERVVAARLRALAAAAIKVVKEPKDGVEANWKGLFLSGLEDFDFIIHLKSSVVKGKALKGGLGGGSEKGKDLIEYKNLQVGEALDVDSIGYDAVELYLDDLRAVFGATALFFWDASAGGDRVIAGLWRPTVTGSDKEWRVRLGWSSVPVGKTRADDGQESSDAKEMCRFNKDAVLAEMAALGDGLVKEIKVKGA